MILSAGILLAIFASLPHLVQALFSLWNNTHTISHTDNTTHITHPYNNSWSQSNDATATTEDTLLNSSDTDPDPLVYRNEEFGFQIKLEKSFANYVVFVDQYKNKDFTRFIFAMPINDPKQTDIEELLTSNTNSKYDPQFLSWYGSIFIITAYSHTAFQRLWSSPDPITQDMENAIKNEYIGQNAHYVFTYWLGHDIPLEILAQPFLNNDTFNRRTKIISMINENTMVF